jgi:hypothetical protein
MEYKTMNIKIRDFFHGAVLPAAKLLCAELVDNDNGNFAVEKLHFKPQSASLIF